MFLFQLMNNSFLSKHLYSRGCRFLWYCHSVGNIKYSVFLNDWHRDFTWCSLTPACNLFPPTLVLWYKKLSETSWEDFANGTSAIHGMPYSCKDSENLARLLIRSSSFISQRRVYKWMKPSLCLSLWESEKNNCLPLWGPWWWPS